LTAGQKVDTDINGRIYILDPDRNTLRLFTKARASEREIGGAGWQNDQFDRPAGLWARNGIDVFVADYGNHRIQRFDRNLNYVSTLYTRENANPEERFGYPTDVALSRLGDLFVCDAENGRIVKVNRFTLVERTFGGFGAGSGRLYAPTQIECGPQDHVYVVDGNRVLVFDNFGNFLKNLLGGTFRPPVSIHADASGVMVVDSTSLFRFDKEERPAVMLPVEEALGMKGIDVLSLSSSQDSIYVLGKNRLQAVVKWQ
jgi:DNA-binding beta-propeller fold protein YncE